VIRALGVNPTNDGQHEVRQSKDYEGDENNNGHRLVDDKEEYHKASEKNRTQRREGVPELSMLQR